MNEPDIELLSNVQHSDLADTFNEHADGAMITRYVTVAEILNDDGERELYVLATPGLKAWDSIGLLAFALNEQQQPAPPDG